MTPTLVCSPLPWSVPLDASRNRLRTCADGRAARRHQPLELFAGDGQERDRRSPRRGTRSCRPRGTEVGHLVGFLNFATVSGHHIRELRWTAVTIDNGDDTKDALDRITIP